MARSNVIPNTHPNLVVVERSRVWIHKNETRQETRQIPIVGWHVDTEDHERHNFFIGLPVIIDDIHNSRWGIMDINTGQVIDQFETVYDSLADFERKMDCVIALQDFTSE